MKKEWYTFYWLIVIGFGALYGILSNIIIGFILFGLGIISIIVAKMIEHVMFIIYRLNLMLRRIYV